MIPSMGKTDLCELTFEMSFNHINILALKHYIYIYISKLDEPDMKDTAGEARANS